MTSTMAQTTGISPANHFISQMHARKCNIGPWNATNTNESEMKKNKKINTSNVLPSSLNFLMQTIYAYFCIINCSWASWNFFFFFTFFSFLFTIHSNIVSFFFSFLFFRSLCLLCQNAKRFRFNDLNS